MPSQCKKPDGALETGDVFLCSKLGKGAFVVNHACYDGGSDGHDPYPDGWHIQYSPLPPETLKSRSKSGFELLIARVYFYQSASYQPQIAPEEIQIIGTMTQHTVVRWKQCPKLTQHDVRVDGAGWMEAHTRYTCYSRDCGGGRITCLRQPYMNKAQWDAEKADFFKRHPCPMDQIKKA